MLSHGEAEEFCAGQVWFFAEVASELYALVNLWVIRSYDSTTGFAVCSNTADAELFHLESVLVPVVWSEDPSGSVRMLVPQEFRGLDPVIG